MAPDSKGGNRLQDSPRGRSLLPDSRQDEASEAMKASIRALTASRWICALMQAVCLLCLFGSLEDADAAGKRGEVWLVFFSSDECPLCSNVDMLVNGLSTKYPLKVKKFSVERRADYALLERLQGIHSDGREFGVPLVMVGEQILVGETEIAAKLEPSVRALSRAGGAPLPYLGPSKATVPKASSKQAKAKCETRPPESPDVWSRVRSFLDRLFPDPVLR